MPIFMLTRIDADKKAFLEGNPGVWKPESNGDFLTRLVNSFEIGGATDDISSIDSIPDVWARPLLFKMALFDKRSELHNRVTGEWRALLAMLALKDIKALNLKAERVNFDDGKMANDNVASVFTRLIPVESFDGNANAWRTDIYVIFYKDKAIAMTSPVTLVASAADYLSAFGGKIPKPWSNDGKTLTDPTTNLPVDELRALSGWLENLHDRLRNECANVGGNSQIILNNLLNCVFQYLQDVNAKLDDENIPQVDLADSGLKLEGMARFLNETVQGKPATVADSAVRLMVNSSRRDRQLLLISPQMVRDLNIENLVIWRGVNPADITDKALSGGRNKIGRIDLGEVEHRRPEEFFYDKMAVVAPDKFSGRIFIGALEVPGIRNIADKFKFEPILPIKSELLEYFSPEEIETRISFSVENNNAISIHFKFPLSGINGVPKEYEFTKTYSGDNWIRIRNSVPVIEIWPNIQRPGWDKYYLYYDNSGAQDNLAMYYVEPWTFGKANGNNFPVQGLKDSFTAKLNNFPETLIFNYKSPNDAVAIKVGAILLKKPELVKRNTGTTWKIGLDFGTSSTMLYFKDENEPPTPLNLKPHLLQITESQADRIQAVLNFIAPESPARQDGSFLSIFHLLNTNKLNDGDIQPLEDGHVLSFVNSRIFQNAGISIDTNLKWQDDPFARRKVAAYIQQICLQAMVEAMANGIDNIQWNFSYPTAFSQAQAQAFDTIFRQGIRDAYANSGFEFKKDNIEIWAESKASAYYFYRLNNQNDNFRNGALCIDIGAGTTDITIISGVPSRIIYHTSVQYAGLYMFKSIYDNYGEFIPMERSGEIQINNLDRRQALIDTDMRNNSANYIKNLPYNTGRQIVKDILQGTQFSVAGLFYYLGKILGKLRALGVYTMDTIPNIFVGGNGSRIFKWLAGGGEIAGDPHIAILEKMLIAASGLKRDEGFRFSLSHPPKVEVASGMIGERPNNDAECFDQNLASGMIGERPNNYAGFFDQNQINSSIFGNDVAAYESVLAGAEFSLNGKKYPAETFIKAQDISNGIRIVSLASFEEFTRKFNASQGLWANGIPLDAESVKDIIRSIDSFYVNQINTEPARIFLEPIFIIELKYLMWLLNYGS